MAITSAPVGILVSSLAAERLAGRRAQKTLILAGFVTTIVKIGLLIGLVAALWLPSNPVPRTEPATIRCVLSRCLSRSATSDGSSWPAP